MRNLSATILVSMAIQRVELSSKRRSIREYYF